MNVWGQYVLLGVASIAAHELAHAAAAWAAGVRVVGWQIGIGQRLTRIGQCDVRAWPVAVGVRIPDAALARAPLAARLAIHAAGPLTNLALAGALSALGARYTLAAAVNLALAGGNLLPLPALDGGWIVTAVAARLAGQPVEKERRCHARYQWLSFVLGFAVPLALGLGLVR